MKNDFHGVVPNILQKYQTYGNKDFHYFAMRHIKNSKNSAYIPYLFIYYLKLFNQKNKIIIYLFILIVFKIKYIHNIIYFSKI